MTTAAIARLDGDGDDPTAGLTEDGVVVDLRAGHPHVVDLRTGAPHVADFPLGAPHLIDLREPKVRRLRIVPQLTPEPTEPFAIEAPMPRGSAPSHRGRANAAFYIALALVPVVVYLLLPMTLVGRTVFGTSAAAALGACGLFALSLSRVASILRRTTQVEIAAFGRHSRVEVGRRRAAREAERSAPRGHTASSVIACD